MRADLQRLKRDTETGRARAASSGTVAAAQESGSQVAAPTAVASIRFLSCACSISVIERSEGGQNSCRGQKALEGSGSCRRATCRGCIAGAFYFRSRQTTHRLTDKDTIVLADFTNSTGDAVFDDTLKTALRVALNQSPFLNVLSDNKVAATLKLMTRPADTKLTPDVARELCQRAGSKAYIAGSIASLGSEYVLGLKAVNCQSGDTLAQEQATAAPKRRCWTRWARRHRSCAASWASRWPRCRSSMFRWPGHHVFARSSESVQPGLKAFNEKGPAAALPYHQRAIELDPNFAMAYEAMGNDYFGLSELGRASEYYTKAFELREHASEREKLTITADYYRAVTGELEKAAQTYQEWIESYPRDYSAISIWALAYAQQGQYEKAAEITTQGLRLAPDMSLHTRTLANYLLALQRFDEARQTIQQAQARKLDNFFLHNALYALAFLGADSSAMAEQQQWFAGKPEKRTLDFCWHPTPRHTRVISARRGN